MLLITGTIGNAMRLKKMDSEWQQKKQTGKIFMKEMTPEERILNRYKEDAAKMRENQKLNEIISKMKAGEALTPEEEQYIARKNPDLYRSYKEMLQEKDSYKEELKHCKTKEQADRARLNKMSSYLCELKRVVNNPAIPDGKKYEIAEKLLAKTSYINKAHNEFVQSGAYAKLPTEEEYKEEKKADSPDTEVKDGEDVEQDEDTSKDTDGITKDTDSSDATETVTEDKTDISVSYDTMEVENLADTIQNYMAHIRRNTHR